MLVFHMHCFRERRQDISPIERMDQVGMGTGVGVEKLMKMNAIDFEGFLLLVALLCLWYSKLPCPVLLPELHSPWYLTSVK